MYDKTDRKNRIQASTGDAGCLNARKKNPMTNPKKSKDVRRKVSRISWFLISIFLVNLLIFFAALVFEIPRNIDLIILVAQITSVVVALIIAARRP